MGGRGSKSRLVGGATLGPVSPSPTNDNVQQITGQTITQADVKTLQQEMGQNGYEAGDPNAYPNTRKLYVNTSKSFNINAYLNSDGQTIHHPASQWDTVMGYSERMVKNDIAKIDAGMKPLSRDLQLYRFVDAEALGRMVGAPNIKDSTINVLIQQIKTNSAVRDSFGAGLKTVDYTQKAYTSTTYEASHGTYDQYPVMLRMVARKGTDAIVTNNHAEHEILLGSKKKYNFTGRVSVRTHNGRDQLVIDVYI